jgi:hypothetical protein
MVEGHLQTHSPKRRNMVASNPVDMAVETLSIFHHKYVADMRLRRKETAKCGRTMLKEGV